MNLLKKLTRRFGWEIMRLPIELRAEFADRSAVDGYSLCVRRVLTQLCMSGQVNINEARLLGELVSNLEGEGSIIEIGTLFGWSTQVMVLQKEAHRELISVDAYVWNPFNLSSDLHFEVTQKTLADAVAHHNVKQVRADKADFYNEYSGISPALVFLDAIHSYEETKKDIEWARSVGAGVICGHDYSQQFPGVMRAVDEFGGAAMISDTLWVLG